jgi:hypothetical protein
MTTQMAFTPIGEHYGDEQLIATAALIESAYDFEMPLPDLK